MFKDFVIADSAFDYIPSFPSYSRLFRLFRFLDDHQGRGITNSLEVK